jgi:uncharacterized membrane protein YedE/YeeE
VNRALDAAKPGAATARRSPRPRPYVAAAIAFVAGAIFAAGLALAGMTQPSKVIGFLDVTGAWDPSLAFVMVGAIAVYFVTSRWILGRPRPLVEPRFHLPTEKRVDPRVVAGSAIFGVGWGLAGYCPGPGIASVGSTSIDAIVFVASMSFGMLVFEAMNRALARRRPGPGATPR